MQADFLQIGTKVKFINNMKSDGSLKKNTKKWTKELTISHQRHGGYGTNIDIVFFLPILKLLSTSSDKFVKEDWFDPNTGEKNSSANKNYYIRKMHWPLLGASTLSINKNYISTNNCTLTD